MQTVADRSEAPTAIRTDLGAIFVSLELSRSTWLITSLSPAGGEKMSKHAVRGGDVAGLLERFAQLREKTRARTGKVFPFVVIQEAGLDGFWIDRVLQNEAIESHVVDPASIATSRRRRRAKTDRIDGEALVRALLAYKRGEPRVCAMVKAPTPKEEDRRRLCRERKVLIAERVRHVNRVKGLLSIVRSEHPSIVRDIVSSMMISELVHSRQHDPREPWVDSIRWPGVPSAAAHADGLPTDLS